MNTNEIEILTRRMIPRPESIKFSDGNVFTLKSQSPVTVEVSDKTGIPFTDLYNAAQKQAEQEENQ